MGQVRGSPTAGGHCQPLVNHRPSKLHPTDMRQDPKSATTSWTYREMAHINLDDAFPRVQFYSVHVRGGRGGGGGLIHRAGTEEAGVYTSNNYPCIFNSQLIHARRAD